MAADADILRHNGAFILGRWNLSARRVGSRSSSLRRDATQAIQSTGDTGWLRRTNDAISSSQVSAMAIAMPVAILLATLLLSILLRATQPRAFSELAPRNATEALGTLWQVHSAVVALSIPLLILLVEQARNTLVISTSVGQVLFSRTRVIFVTVVSLGSVVTIGFSALYLVSDAVLIVDFGLSALCITLILLGYCRALEMLLSPSQLRAESQKLLERRLAASMARSFELRWMDERLVSILRPWNPGQLLSVNLDQGEWSVARSTGKGRVVDVDASALVRLLNGSVPGSAFFAAPTAPTDRRSRAAR
jgi:hypothetical protein